MDCTRLRRGSSACLGTDTHTRISLQGRLMYIYLTVESIVCLQMLFAATDKQDLAITTDMQRRPCYQYIQGAQARLLLRPAPPRTHQSPLLRARRAGHLV